MIRQKITQEQLATWLQECCAANIQYTSLGTLFLSTFFPGHVDHRFDSLDGRPSWVELFDEYVAPQMEPETTS